MKTISRTKAKNMILKTDGKFFSVQFVKKNGEMRDMNCRLGVTKHLKGGQLAFNPKDYKLIVVFDTLKKNYRMISIETLKKVTISGETYKVA